MISDEDILADTVTILSHYGERYQWLIKLLQAQCLEQFYHLLVEVGKRDQSLLSQQEELSNIQNRKVQYLLTLKLAEFDVWDVIDFQRIIPALNYLNQSVKFTLPYSVIHNKISNLATKCELICTQHHINLKHKESKKEFFQDIMNILYNPQCNKQSFNYQSFQGLGEKEKGFVEILTIACLSRTEGNTIEQSKKEDLLKQYLNTQNPKYLGYLLLIDCKLNDEIKAEILNLRLQKVGNQWKLVGNCRVNRQCLTSANLKRCLSTYKYSYKYLVDNFFAEDEEGISFKFDILELLPKPGQQETVFTCLMKYEENKNELSEYCKRILSTASYLVQAVQTNKSLSFFTGISIKKIQKTDRQRVLFFCLKLLSFPFRTYYRKIKVDIAVQQINSPLTSIIRKYNHEQQVFSPTLFNNICQIFRWAHENQKYTHIITALFSKEQNAEDTGFSRLFLQSLRKYLKYNKDIKLQYHAGIWLLRYFAARPNAIKLLQQAQDQFCLQMYEFVTNNNKYFRVQRYEMNQYIHDFNHKSTYYDMISQMLKNNPNFIVIVFSYWMKQLEDFEQSKLIYQRSRKHRLALLIIVFNSQSFPVTEEIKLRLRNLIISYDYQKTPLRMYRKTWPVFAKKINLKPHELILTIIDQLLIISEDQDIISKNFTNKYFRIYVSKDAQQFVRKLCLLDCLLNMNKEALSQTHFVKLTRLLSRYNTIKAKNNQCSQVFASQQTVQTLQKNHQLSISSFVAKAFRFDDSIRYLLTFISGGFIKLPIVNTILIELGNNLNEIQRNYKNPQISYKLLSFVTSLIRQKSKHSLTELFLQFYNYHKKDIIQLIQSFVQYYPFEFQEEDSKENTNDLQYTIRLKRQKRDVAQGIRMLNVSLLYTQIKKLTCQIFANSQWQPSILVNDTRYSKVNTLLLFEKSMQYDLAIVFLKADSSQKYLIFFKIYKIISQAYHRGQKVDLECGKDNLNLPLPYEQITIFTKTSELSVYYQAYADLLRQSLKHYRIFENSKLYEYFYVSAIVNFQGEQRESLEKQLLGQLIQQLQQILVRPIFLWDYYQKVHAYINIMLQSYTKPLGNILKTQFLQTYLNHFRGLIRLQAFQGKQTTAFLKFVQRLVPHSKPEVVDEHFYSYISGIVFVCSQLLKADNTQGKQDITISLISKIIRLQDHIFDAIIVQLFKNIQHLKDIVSSLLCQILQTRIRLASIQLEIKCFFLKLCEKNNGDWEKAVVKISQFVSIFSNKHQFHKKEFIQVVEALTRRDPVKKNKEQINYIRLISVEDIQWSVYLKSRFVDYDFNDIYKPIITSYLENIDKDPNLFKMKLRQLRIIAFNYPLIVSYILMHPMLLAQATVPFVDYLFNKVITEDLDKEIYEFFAYTALDFSHILNFEGKTIFFSQFLCQKYVRKAAQTQITNRNLIFIFFMSKIKRFANYCFVKIKDGKSLYQILWEALQLNRQEYLFEQNTNILIYITLSLLSRFSNYRRIINYCDYKQRPQECQTFNGFYKQSFIPLTNVILKKQYQCIEELYQKQAQIENFEQDLQNSDFQFSKWYSPYTKKQKPFDQSILEDWKVHIQAQYLKHIGYVFNQCSESYVDISSLIDNSFEQRHNSTFSALLIFFLQHQQGKDNYTKIRKNMSINTYYLYEDLLDEENQDINQDNKHQLFNQQINTNRQSSFAPEEFLTLNNRPNLGHEENSSLEQQLQSIFNKQTTQQKAQKVYEFELENTDYEFTEQMFDLMNQINQNVAFLQNAPMTIVSVQGKTLQQKHQFLKVKYLETEFDYKQQTMGEQQFEEYCLANVSKLERLGSERRNIVRNIEDLMLLRHVQRSISSDSVDYIIDTIDQNYQLLSNTQQNKNDVETIVENSHKNQSKQSNVIKSSQLDTHIFEDLNDDQLYEMILSFYYKCSLFPISYFTPFLENKRTQKKIINTLLYLYYHPFDSPMFPKNLWNYNLLQSKWVSLDNTEDSIQIIRQSIVQAFTCCFQEPFYQAHNYLNQLINRKGIKDITFEPNHQIEINSQTYSPIYEVLQFCLQLQVKAIQEQEQYEPVIIFRLFRGVTHIKENQLDNLLIILQRIHTLSANKSENQSQITNYKDIQRLIATSNKYQIHKNMCQLLKVQIVRKAIRAKFPIEYSETDLFFVSLFIGTGVYSKQYIINLHRTVIKKDEVKSSSIYFINQAFKLYQILDIQQCSVFKQSKKIALCVVESLSTSQKIRQQPFYKLCDFPKMLPLSFKAAVLDRKVQEYKNDFEYSESIEVVVQRKRGIVQSAFLELRSKPDAFWFQQFAVKFMNEGNVLESGYGRGVAKDWYANLTKGMVDLNYGIFMKTCKNFYFFNRQSWINPRHLQFLEFIGKLFAISIINKDMYLTPSFSILLYKMIVGEKIELADIVKEFDEGEVITNIEKLREYQDDSLFCETFVYEDKRLISERYHSIINRKQSMEAGQNSNNKNKLYLLQEAVQMKIEHSHNHPQGMKEEEIVENEKQTQKMIKIFKIGQSIELIPGGANIVVTMENREQFITLIKKKIYDTIINGVQQQFIAFMAGFKRVVKLDFIKGITAQELRELAEGCDKIDIEDLKKHVTLLSGMDMNPQIQWLWGSLAKLSQVDKQYFIQHWTGLPKISAQGFKEAGLKITKGLKKGRLFAQTCFNQLIMPEFSNEQEMEEAVIMAVNSVKKGESIIEDQ